MNCQIFLTYCIIFFIKVSANNRRRRERLNQVSSENDNLDHIASVRRQSPTPRGIDRRINDDPGSGAPGFSRERTQESEILDEFLRQRSEKSWSTDEIDYSYGI